MALFKDKLRKFLTLSSKCPVLRTKSSSLVYLLCFICISFHGCLQIVLRMPSKCHGVINFRDRSVSWSNTVANSDVFESIFGQVHF